MPIIRSLAAPAVLLIAVAAWLWAASLDSPGLRVLSADMAPLVVAPADPLPERPPADADWQPLDLRELAGWQGPYWLRWHLSAPASDSGRVLRLSLRAASRAWWNGQALPANGVVGRDQDGEAPGLVDSIRVLPPSARDRHELVVLASSHRQWLRMDIAEASLGFVPVERPALALLAPWLIVAAAAGALGAAWLYFLAAQRGQARTRDVQLLLALGLVGMALPLLEAWRPLLGYPYPWHALRLCALLALHVAAALLLPAYLARRFAVSTPRPLRLAWLAALAGAVLLLPGFDSRGAAVLLLSLLASTWLLARVRGDEAERRPLLLMMLAGALMMPLLGSAFLDGPYVLLLAVLMSFLLLRHAARLRTLDRHNAWLRGEHARLSLQLLQRGIQPHWLMNTLTCLQELIEQSPERASRLVESLAEQFERLRESSRHPLLPLADELALCRSHLDIVGVALGRPIGFEVDGDHGSLQLPPGVLHAQVENLLTHAGADACARHAIRLHLRGADGCRVIELRGPRGASAHCGEGTGTRFIEASLAAAFPGRWRFTQGADGADWSGRIELACAS